MVRTLLVTLVLLQLASAGAAAPARASGDGSDFELGRAATRAGDSATAIAHLRRATAAFPTWGLAQLELAEALILRGPEEPGLLQALEAARTLEPGNPRAWRLTGRWHELRGETGAAIESYARAVTLRPDLLDARERLGLLLAQQGRHAEAVGHLSAVTLAAPAEWGLRGVLADALEKTERVAEAEAELKAVAAGSRSLVFQRRLADFYERHGQAEKAEAVRREADKGRDAGKAKRPLPASKW